MRLAAARGDAEAGRRGCSVLWLALLSEEALAYQLGMRELGTTRASAQQRSAADALC